MKIMNAPNRVRAYVCDLHRHDRIKGPGWKVYETEEYDPATDTVNIHGVVFRVEDGMKDIRNNDELLETLTDLKHYLKAGQPYSPMRAAFDQLLTKFLEEHKPAEDLRGIDRKEK